MEGILNLFSKAMIKTKVKEEPDTKAQNLLDQIRDTEVEMGAIRCCFDMETNFDLIDAYILQLDALEKRYSYLIKQAKQHGIVAF
ncbi:DUF2508 family protein [Paludicola sp. MB14-C6]|uniref:DUF2508 family protein n=1 Tax=Paludihabitans sp. MB14-C6 TaxID=3070656 RepID=UPI0027DCBB72|nr:DUF2508 family protein [Paludicola sp. MB14-C6]WMJ24424.1 DUF2508 family protein [Paludicola sp. MB14-C6]